MPLASVSNKVNGVAGWDKSVTDVNNVDENFSNARDLGYSRLNRTRISVIGRLGQYDSSDTYRVQIQSNGKLFINIRNGDSVEADNNRQKAYEAKLKELQNTLADMGIKQEDETAKYVPQTPLEKAKAAVEKMKEERAKANAGLLDELAPGMSVKVYKRQGNKTVLVGDTTANKNSKEYTAMKSIMEGNYRAKKGDYYIEVSSTDKTIKEEKPYVLQIKQGRKYTDDYLVTEANSEDTNNKTVSLTSSTSSSEQISSAYAAQIQAQRYEATTTMLTSAYSNLASINNKASKSDNLMASLLNTSV